MLKSIAEGGVSNHASRQTIAYCSRVNSLSMSKHVDMQGWRRRAARKSIILVVIQGGNGLLVLKMKVTVALERWSFNRGELNKKYYSRSQNGRNNQVSVIYRWSLGQVRLYLH